ncbi:MAG: mechanosensitive ion channel family protein [Kofleriaceae bacterium]
MDELLNRLGATFSWHRISSYLAETLVPDVVVGGTVFFAFWMLHRLVRRVLLATLQRTHLDATAQAFVLSITKYVILTVGLISTLAQLGINTGGLLASLGVAGLTIGFAARDTLSNIISGLFIFWDRPFVVGDLVEVGGQYGQVQEITMRSTRVVTVDGKMLAIPNNAIVNSTVASYTNFPHLRLDVGLTIGVDEDLPRTRALLVAIVEGDARFAPTPAPAVVVTAINDYNVAIELRAWIVDERQHIPLRLELRERMFEALRQAGVVMPYQTLALAPVEVRHGADAARA